MLKVNNKKTIGLLARSSFAANKLRNLFVVIAIVLTTVLFTGFFTIASSLISSMEESTMRQVGSNFHGGFKYLTAKEYERLKDHKSIKESSYSVVLGIGENIELAKRPTEIRYTSNENNARGMFSMPTTGRLPQSDNEIATDTLVLDRLGIPAKLGEKVMLEYSVGGKKRKDTFTLVGFWQGDKLMQASQVWLNRTYVEKQLADYMLTYDGDAIGTISANVNFDNAFNIEGKLQKVILESGYSLDDIDYGVNWAYTGNSGGIDGDTIIAAIGAIVMIIFCGYLIISNVFYISIAKDIRYFGLLKTIGTTPKQIKGIIGRQSLWLSLIGVPIGLFVGYIVGAMLVPTVLLVMNTDVVKVSINPIIFVLSGLFAVVTVAISISKPSKLAAKVSPIEALRSTDTTQNTKKEVKRGHCINLFTMTWSNIIRNKKKALLVTLSLSLGLIVLNATYSLANSFDIDKYISKMIGSDFAVGDVSNFNVHIHYLNQDTLSKKFFEDLSLQKGIENKTNIYFAEPDVPTDSRLLKVPQDAQEKLSFSGEWLEAIQEQLNNPKQFLHIYGLDNRAFERLNLLEGSIDMEKLESGKYVIADPYDEEGVVHYYDIGDKVVLPNVAGEIQEYEVLAIATIPHNISIQHSHPITPGFYLPSEVFLSQIENKTPMLTTLDVTDNNEEEMEQFLENYCENIDSNMAYQSKSTLVAEYKNTQKTFKTVGVTLSILLATIGIMNFINTIITSVMARKRELAMLQSIGMTDKQTKQMLIGEGVLYIVLTIGLTLTIGSIICYFGLKEFVVGSPYMSLYFTAVPSLICLPVLLTIAVVVPLISQKVISKSSIVERLREVE